MSKSLLPNLCMEKIRYRCPSTIGYDGLLEARRKKGIYFPNADPPNVPADELNDEIKHYNQSFQRLMQRKEVKQIVKGYARKLEITYNEERDDYHPHFHVLIAV